MFIQLTRHEDNRLMTVNIHHIYEVLELAGIEGCELIFPHDKVVVTESYEKVTKMLMARNLTSTHH